MKRFFNILLVLLTFSMQLHELSHHDLVDNDSHSCPICLVKANNPLGDAPAITIDHLAPIFLYNTAERHFLFQNVITLSRFFAPARAPPFLS